MSGSRSIDTRPARLEDYPHPSLTVDCVGFGLDEGDLKVLLIERGVEPFRGTWALPGGFVRMDESLDEAALRELGEEAGITRLFLEQLYTFGDLGRDPRGRVVTVAYYALVELSQYELHATTDARSARWFPVSSLPKLAFDHDAIVRTGLARLQGKIRYQPIGFELLPAKFTLSQLQHLYEVILGKPLDKRNFRKKILKMGLLKPLRETEKGVRHRAARLYRFERARYRQLASRGFLFSSDMVVEFYSVRGPLGCFSNFSPHPFELDGLRWPTSEHYFQAQKFAGTPREERIRNAATPAEAARLGRRRDSPLRTDWETVKDDVMRRAVLAKFGAHADIAALLVGTGEEPIVERTTRDRYWGCGSDRSGRNMLGRILEETRSILRGRARG